MLGLNTHKKTKNDPRTFENRGGRPPEIWIFQYLFFLKRILILGAKNRPKTRKYPNFWGVFPAVLKSAGSKPREK